MSAAYLARSAAILAATFGILHLENPWKLAALLMYGSGLRVMGCMNCGWNAPPATVRIHRMASPAHDKAIAALLDDLTQLAFLHPETHARLIYQLV